MNSTFFFNDHEYVYLESHRLKGERTVEVPIVWREASALPSDALLEFGNVLKHHFPQAEHRVVDKRRKEKGAINVDIVDLDLRRTFDMIVSISTIEHVGHISRKYGEAYDPHKHRKAMEVLLRHLKGGGKLLFTWPVGYNEHLDEDVRRGLIFFDEILCMKRISETEWLQISPDWTAQYGVPFKRGNVIIIATRYG